MSKQTFWHKRNVWLPLGRQPCYLAVLFHSLNVVNARTPLSNISRDLTAIEDEGQGTWKHGTLGIYNQMLVALDEAMVMPCQQQ